MCFRSFLFVFAFDALVILRQTPYFGFEKTDVVSIREQPIGVFQKKLIRKSLSAFGASSLEYVSAVGCSHSLSETVFLLSLSLFGLISSEHLLHLLDLGVILPEA